MDKDELIKEVTRLRLHPDEVLVLTLDEDKGWLDADVVFLMKRHFAEALGIEERRIVFLSSAISMSIIDASDARGNVTITAGPEVR